MANGPRAHDRRARRELFQKQRDICVPDGCKPDPGQLTGSRTAGSRAGAKAGGVRRRRHSHRNPTEGGRYAVRLGKGDTPTPRWYPLPSGRDAADSSFAARLARPRRLPPDTACRGMSGHGSLDPGTDGPRGLLLRFAEVVAARVPHPRRWRRDAFRGPVSRDRVGTGNGLFFFTALSQRGHWPQSNFCHEDTSSRRRTKKIKAAFKQHDSVMQHRHEKRIGLISLRELRASVVCN